MSLQPAQNAKKTKRADLKPGRSLLNWITYCAANPDLSSFFPKPKFITSEQLKKHDKVDDCWMAIQGGVYNVTPYMEYHPGGIDELMSGAGKDATSLFMEVHKWVNYPKLLEKCYIAPYKKLSLAKDISDLEKSPKHSKPIEEYGQNKDNNAKQISKLTSPTDTSLLCDNRSNTPIYDLPSIKPILSYRNCDWLSISLTSPKANFQTGFISQLTPRSSRFIFYLPRFIYIVNLEYEDEMKNLAKIDWSQALEGKIEIAMHSKLPLPNTEEMITLHRNFTIFITEELITLHHPPPDCKDCEMKVETRENLFNPHPLRDTLTPASDVTLTYHRCQLIERTAITHDTYHMKFEFPQGMSGLAPVGYHVYLKLASDLGIELTKPYTPVPQNLENPFQTATSSSCSPKNSVIPLSHRYLTFIIKIYPDGPMSQALYKLKLGECVLISEFDGDFDEKHLWPSEKKLDTLLLLAAGTGITPMIAIINKLIPGFEKDGHCRNSSGIQRLVLIDFNKTEHDIIWGPKLRNIAEAFPKNFYYQNVLSQPEVTWLGPRGRISVQSMQNLMNKIIKFSEQLLPDKTFVCLCGSSAFNESAKKVMTEMGYNEENFHTFK